MASATFTLFDEFGNELGKAGHNLSTAVIKAYLTSSTPVKATNATRADHTVLSGNGSDEKTVTATWAETGAGTGVWRLTIGADQTWTGSGAGFEQATAELVVQQAMEQAAARRARRLRRIALFLSVSD